MNFVVVIFILCGVVWGNEYDFRVIDSIKQERPCTNAGGMCVIEKDCADPSEEKGLCPTQRSHGVECCYGVSDKETRCGKRGGECTSDFCGETVLFRQATDCPNGTKCCILVK